MIASLTHNMGASLGSGSSGVSLQENGILLFGQPDSGTLDEDY